MKTHQPFHGYIWLRDMIQATMVQNFKRQLCTDATSGYKRGLRSPAGHGNSEAPWSNFSPSLFLMEPPRVKLVDVCQSWKDLDLRKNP